MDSCSELFVCINNKTDRQVATNIFNGHEYDWAKGTRPNTNLHERVIGAHTEIAELSQMSAKNTTTYHLGLTISDGSYVELVINHGVKVDMNALTAALINEICSVSGNLNKYRVERTVTDVEPLHLNINIFELEEDVNLQFIQQEASIQKPVDGQQQQVVNGQSPMITQLPMKREHFDQIPGAPRSPVGKDMNSTPQSPIKHEVFDHNPTDPQSPIRHERFEQNPEEGQTQIQHQAFDQYPTAPQSPIRQGTFEQNPDIQVHQQGFEQDPITPQSPNRHQRFEQDPELSQSQIEQQAFDGGTATPQSPIQHEIDGQNAVSAVWTVREGSTEESNNQHSPKKSQMTWEEILMNVKSLTECFIQMEIIEECKNYVQFIVHYEDFDQIIDDTQETIF